MNESKTLQVDVIVLIFKNKCETQLISANYSHINHSKYVSAHT